MAKITSLTKRLLEVAIALALVGLGWRLLPMYFPANPANEWLDASAPFRLGGRYVGPGMAPVRRHVVLFVNTSCPACNSSHEFFRRLGESVTRRSDTDLVIVSSEPIQEVQAWLRSARIRTSVVARAVNLAKVGLVFTPTLLMTTAEGIITDIAESAVPADLESRILARIDNPQMSPPVNASLLAAEASIVSAGATRIGTQLVDIRSRGSYPVAVSGVIHIPYDELNVRSRAELDRRARVAIDCTRESLYTCRVAGADLRSLGFGDVVVLVPSMRATR